MKPYTNLTVVIQYIIANNDMLYVSHDLWVWSVLKYNGVKKKATGHSVLYRKGILKKKKMSNRQFLLTALLSKVVILIVLWSPRT